MRPLALPLQPDFSLPTSPVRAGGVLTPGGAGRALAPDGGCTVPLQGPGRRGGTGGEPHHCQRYVRPLPGSSPRRTGPSDGLFAGVCSVSGMTQRLTDPVSRHVPTAREAGIPVQR